MADPGIPRNLIGQPARFKQVISGLLQNSVKSTNYGEVTINVDAEKLDGRRLQLKITVSSTGINIPAERLAKMIEYMDKEITVDNREGPGCKFCFTPVLSVPQEGGMDIENENPGGRR